MPVKIHGKDYRTVAERVNQIHADYPNNVSIENEIISHEITPSADLLQNRMSAAGLSRKQISEIINGVMRWEVVVQATVTIHTSDGERRFRDFAHEKEDLINKKSVNHTSYVENGCTSAIGRALAAAGRSGDEYASADELTAALEHADGDLLATIRDLREKLKEAQETEAALKTQITELKRRQPPLLLQAESQIQNLSNGIKNRSEQIQKVLDHCTAMVGPKRLDAILNVIPSHQECWNRAEAILLLALCELNKNN